PFVPAAAFDIRIDNRTNLIEFFEDRVDGVEFDEELGVESVLPAETNAIYVQIHNRGSATVVDGELHLFWAEVPVPFPASGAPALPADFWPRFRLDPMPPSAGPIAPPIGDWRRVGMRTGLVIRPGDPVVARFDFVPPATLAERRIALLAVGHSPREDPLPAPPPPPALDAPAPPP